MNRILVFLFSLTSTLTSCSGTEMKEIEITLNDITQKTAEEITARRPDMELIGTGGSISDNLINHETMVFNVYKQISEIEGIELINEIAILHIKNVNSDKRMSSYLKERTFDIKNLKIKLHPYTPEGDDVFHPNIAFFNLEEGVFYFMSMNESRKGFVSRKELSYEKAILLIDRDHE
jgi:hypothetical protein